MITLGISEPGFHRTVNLEGTPPPDADFWYQDAGSISGGDAIKIAAVGACVRLLAETVASLPLHVFRRTADDGRETARDHPVYYVLHDMANDYQTNFEFLEYAMRQILCCGASLSKIILDAKNQVIALQPLPWDQITIRKDEQTGIRVFVYRDGATTETLVDSEVLFIPGPGCTPFKVVSLLDQHCETIGLSAAAQKYVKTYFSKGALGPVYATFPTQMGQKVLNDWLTWFAKNFMGARNQGRIPVFDNGGKLENLKVDHQQMQLVDLRRFGIEEIARIFGCPPHLIGELMRSTNNNIEHQTLEFVKYHLRPWLVRIEKRLNASLFGPIESQRYFAEFDMDGLLRGDSAAQATLLAAEFQNAVRTPNEARRVRNLQRMADPAADELWAQSGTAPIRLVAQQQNQTQGAPAQ